MLSFHLQCPVAVDTATQTTPGDRAQGNQCRRARRTTVLVVIR